MLSFKSISLGYKSTNEEFVLKKTANNEGLEKSDHWVEIDITIFNDDISFKGRYEFATIKELKSLIDNIELLLKGKINAKKRLTFIKNYVEFEFLPNRTLIQKLHIYTKRKNDYYILKYNEEEMIKLYDIVKEFIEVSKSEK